ncbi:MAG: dienelactone hydrolase family protein [Bacillus subtilis]|nr:dienelactone hydrolase family protein [Bacillus subtilis]
MTGSFYGDISPLSAVSVARAPILFLHGVTDRFIPKEHSERLFEACSSPKRLKLFEDSRHAESLRKNRIAYHEEVARFLSELVVFEPQTGTTDVKTGGTRDV